jgi:hypothetical protein
LNTDTESDKSFSEYGSVVWANFILRLGIAECNNVDRVGFARLQEIFYIMRVLSEHGYEWQARRLRNHLHLAMKKGRFTALARADPIKVGRGGLS